MQILAEEKKKEKNKKTRVKFVDNVKDEKRGINNEIWKKNEKYRILGMKKSQNFVNAGKSSNSVSWDFEGPF